MVLFLKIGSLQLNVVTYGLVFILLIRSDVLLETNGFFPNEFGTPYFGGETTFGISESQGNWTQNSIRQIQGGQVFLSTSDEIKLVKI